MLRPLLAALLVFAAFIPVRARAAEAPAPAEFVPTKPAPSPVTRIVRSLDAGWRFLRGDAPGAEAPAFNDATWRQVDVPHDWAIEGAVDRAAPTGSGGGYRPSGVSWYRQRFSLPASAAEKRIFVEFDGVMGNSEAWINGQRLGARPNGYLGFTYELTGRVHLGDGQANVLAVRTDTTPQPASRTYTGQGILRPARILITDTVRIAPWGVTVTTPQVGPDGAVIRVRTQLGSAAPEVRRIAVAVSIRNPEGLEVATVTSRAQPVGLGENPAYTGEVTVMKPDLWDLGRGRLYTAVVQLRTAEAVLDEVATPFGLREARFEPDQGLSLNGKPVKLKGVILPSDGGAFGAAVPLRVWERRLERLREVGVNALRFPQPAAPALLDLCDRLGFLVLADYFEAWSLPQPGAEKGSHLYFAEWGQRDQRDLVRRDRNHPSLVMWNAGSDIPDTENTPLAKNLLSTIVGLSHTEDPTRPVTLGLFRPGLAPAAASALVDMPDIVGGRDVGDAALFAAQKENPRRLIVATQADQSGGSWVKARDRVFHLGQFVATGVDSLGGAEWPAIGSSTGLLDRTGRPKPIAHERQSLWTSAPAVTHDVRTAGAPAKLILAAERPSVAHDWNDVAFVTVSTVDANGIPSAQADTLVSFKLSGPGVLAAVDNGDPTDATSFQAAERKLYRGQAVAFVKANAPLGAITLTASAPGLPDATITLQATPAPTSAPGS